MAADDDETDGGGTDCRILCLTGPESTGKSTLAAALSEALDAVLVPEVARSYLAGRHEYAASDVLAIAEAQEAAERRALESGAARIVCDTDLTVIRVWWEEKYGAPPAPLTEALERRSPRAYLLLEPDLPWAPDPLRENPEDRGRLFSRYRELLEGGPFPYRQIAGLGEARLTEALVAAEQLLN
ncbi:MAG: ATP-binding protein [Pseudomonadota bacterium]